MELKIVFTYCKCVDRRRLLYLMQDKYEVRVLKAGACAAFRPITYNDLVNLYPGHMTWATEGYRVKYQNDFGAVTAVASMLKYLTAPKG